MLSMSYFGLEGSFNLIRPVETTLSFFIFQMLLVQTRRHLTGLVGDKSNAAVILGANFSAGFIAGVISAGATCPLDVAKTRRQIEASVGL